VSAARPGRDAGAWQAIGAIALNDLRRVARDRVALFFIVVLPVVIIVLIGTTFGGDQGFDVAVLDRDGSTASEGLVEALDSGDGVSVKPYDSVTEMRRDIRTGTVAAGLMVPAGYGERLGGGEDATVDLIADPTSGSAVAVQASVRAAVGDEAVRIAAARLYAEAGGSDDVAAAQQAVAGQADQVAPAEVRTVPVDEGGSATFGTFDYTAPSNLVLFTFINTTVAGTALALERRQGITRRILASPHGTGTILAGIGASKLLFALVQSVLIVAVGALVFGVGWGDPLAAGLLVLLFALVATSVGLLLGATVSDPDQAQAVGVPVAIGLAMLGGCMWPLEVVPPVMRAIGHVAPHAWAMDAWQDVIFDGAGAAAIAGPLAVLAGFALVLGLVARHRLRHALTG
jgi:ABC-2 type transport system permease protein